MANPIDLIVTQEAIKGVEILISKLTDARDKTLSLGEAALGLSKSYTKVSTPSALNNNTAANAQINADVKKQAAEIARLHEVIAKAAEKSRLAEIKLQQDREKSFDSYSKLLAKKEADEIKASNKIIAQKEKEFAIFEKQFNKYEADLAKKAIAEEKASQKAIIATNRQAEAEAKQALARRQAFDKNDAKLSQQTAKELSAYNRIQVSVNTMTKTYNDLAIRKQLGNTLSAAEEKQLVGLTSRIKMYQDALLKTDATIGKSQRNVGNYASGYNALGNSINQLSREAPAFANSVNTGFMALSNNFPALFDAINGIRDKNKMLIAEGKPTVSVLKSIAGALFSWQTLLSVGVTLLTLYGGKIVSWVGSMMTANKGLQSLAENQKQLNEALKESSGSYAEQKVNIDVLYKTANDLNASYKDRKRAVDELQELYPFYFKNLSDEAIMTGEAKDQYTLLSQAIVTVAKARASEEILQKRESERLVKEEQDNEKRLKKQKELANAKGTTSYVSGGGSVAGSGTSSIQETVEQQKARLRKELLEDRKKQLKEREQWAKEDAFFIAKVMQGNTVEQTLKPAIKETKNLTKAKKEKVSAEKLEIVSSLQLSKTEDTALERLKTLKKALEQTRDETSKNSTEFQQFETSIKAVNEAIDFMTKGIAPIKLDIKVPVNPNDIDNLKELSEGVKNYLSSFSGEFMSNAGFSETFAILNGEIEGFGENFAVTFNAIAESAQEAFNFISNASQANFDNERKRIEDQQAIAISYAGGSATAINKINEDAEKRKKNIANRENKAKQKMALFNIGIDMAQGIVSALASTPPNIGLSIAIGAIGAVQLGMVASQKIPQYFDGTDNHTGGLMLVNDGKGANYQEKVILPNGKEITPQGRNVLMDAPKGTKVLTHEQQLFEMMQSKGINMTANYNRSNGMTKSDMDDVLSKHFANIKTHNTTFDGNGFKSYIQNGNSRTISTANRVSGSGISV